MKKPKAKSAYAVVKKGSPVIRVLDIYESKDVVIDSKLETIIKVKIVAA
jgi:hypothetical protein